MWMKMTVLRLKQGSFLNFLVIMIWILMVTCMQSVTIMTVFTSGLLICRIQPEACGVVSL